MEKNKKFSSRIEKLKEEKFGSFLNIEINKKDGNYY